MAKLQRTPLSERPFPDYTHSEEMWNMGTHIFGAISTLFLMALALKSALASGSRISVVSTIVYMLAILAMFTVSAVYHGLPKSMPKQVMRTVDHCNIFVTIAGTYTPITLLGICSVNPTLGWWIFGIEWGLALVGILFNAIDLKKYSKFSMTCYLGMGWCVLISMREAIQSMTLAGFMWIIAGGVAYTIGAVLYLIGKKKNYRYMHTVFHVFVVIAAWLQFVGLWWYLLK